METVLKAIADWIKGILTAGIMSNLSGLFDAVNEQVGDIAQQVGTRPSAFEPRVFAMIESLSRNVVLPIAGIILTFIACYELIEMITQHNNMAQFEPALIMRWIFKTAVSVWFISNTFDIVMAVFDLTQKVVSDSSGIIAGNTRVNEIGLSMLEASLMQMDVGPLFGLFLQSFFIGITMRILSIVIFVIVYGRMIEIYCMVSLAPIPMATWGNHEQSHMGQNYLKCLFALGFQGFLILICVAIYAVLIQNVAISGDAINSIWGIYCAASFLSITASDISDQLLKDFLDMDSSQIVTMHIQSVDQNRAIKTVKRTITELDRSKIEEQKKAIRAGYDIDIIPSDLATYGRDAKALLKELQSQNERMFLVTFLVLNTGRTEQKLENNVFQASSIAQKHNCNLCRLDYQQEQGLMSSLPLADNQIEIQRGLTTSSTAIFIPFTTQELYQSGKESLYYGLNALSNNLIIKKFGALLVSAVLCIGMAAPAFAYEGDTTPVEEPVLPEIVEEEDAVTITDEETGALTPEGNLTLVDDYHTNYSDGSGQQFITMVSKSGATFYLVIDRNAKGQQTVHFMNLVDEADLLALMEEEAAEAYNAEKEAAKQAELDKLKAEEEAKKAAEEAAASDAEQPKENKVTKYAAAFLGVVALIALVAGGGFYFFIQQKHKKQAEKEAADPDADYTEDNGTFEIPPEDDSDDEDTSEEQDVTPI